MNPIYLLLLCLRHQSVHFALKSCPTHHQLAFCLHLVVLLIYYKAFQSIDTCLFLLLVLTGVEVALLLLDDDDVDDIGVKGDATLESKLACALSNSLLVAKKMI